MNNDILAIVRIDYRNKKKKKVIVVAPQEIKKILNYKKIKKYFI